MQFIHICKYSTGIYVYVHTHTGYILVAYANMFVYNHARVHTHSRRHGLCMYNHNLISRHICLTYQYIIRLNNPSHMYSPANEREKINKKKIKNLL